MHSSNNDEGSVGGIFYFFAGLVIVAYIFRRVLYPIGTGVIDAHNKLSTIVEPSVVYQKSMTDIQAALVIIPIVIFLIFIFSLIVLELRERYGTV